MADMPERPDETGDAGAGVAESTDSSSRPTSEVGAVRQSEQHFTSSRADDWDSTAERPPNTGPADD